MNQSFTLLRQLLWGVLLLFLLPCLLPAQNSVDYYELIGTVSDAANGEAMPAVTVRLMNKGDGKLVKGTTTDGQGVFSLGQLSAGDYRLIITFVGYNNIEKALSLSKVRKVNLGRLKMTPDETTLKELQVTGRVRPIVLKQDTVEFNAAAFKVREGANIEELLKKLPGVEVDADGNISYNGEKIQKIEVDGRNFFSDDPKKTTRNLPSLMVDRVQVVDKQSDESILTGMDDGTRTKVLNLSIKPDMKKGFVANINGGYGTERRYTGDAMLNFFDKHSRYSLLGNFNNTEGILSGEGDRDTRRVGFNYETSLGKTFELTAEVGYDGENNDRSGSVMRENLLGQQKRNIYTEDYRDLTRNNRLSALSRMEWRPDSMTTIFFTPEFSWSRGRTESTQAFETRSQDNVLINKGASLRTSNNDNIDGQMSLHLSRTLNSRGRHVYIGLEGSINQTEGSGSNILTTEFFREGKPSEKIDQSLNNSNKAGGFILRSSYIEPLSKYWAMQLVYRLEARHRDNRREAYNKDTNGQYTILDEVYTRGSTSTFRNHSVGINLRYKVDRSHITFGIDARPSYAGTISTIGNREVFNKSRVVWNYAPSVRIEYRSSDSISFNLRYSGRTSHASMDQLNPAVVINSPLSKVTGNPDLLPSFSHSLRFMGNYNSPSKRRTFGIMGRASLTDNAIVDRRTIDPETGAVNTTFENVSGLVNVGLGMMASLPFGRSPWSLSAFGRFGYERIKAYINDELNTANIFTPMIAPKLTWRGQDLSVSLGARGAWQMASNSVATNLDRRVIDHSLSNEINWSLPWSFELTSNLVYTHKSGYSGGLDKDIYLWDISLGKSFLRGNAATIEISVFDILGQRDPFSRMITSTSITDRTVNTIGTYGMLTFKYRFNSFGKGNEPKSNSGFSRGRPGGGHPRSIPRR
ncbi:MAG: TonB-dependent receptor [Porphyromonas sp.]|nr:TonB-dependent receptor [Porphyromonas sp.]